LDRLIVSAWLAESAGGFGSYLLGLNKKTYELSGVSTPGNAPGSYKEPAIGWMMGFLLSVCFVGLLTLLPIRKVLLLGTRHRHSWSSSLSDLPCPTLL